MTQLGTSSVRREPFAFFALAPLLLVAVVATYCGAALTWDGGSLLFDVLDGQRFSLPHGRLTVALFQLPVLLASKLTDHVRILEFVYGASYAIVPFVVAFLAWRIVRNVYPRLFIWPLLWICLGAMPGQMFFISECIIALHGSWLLLLLVGTGFSRRRWVLFLTLCPCLFFLHPISGPLFLGISALAGLRMWAHRLRSRHLLTAGILLGFLGFVRLLVTWRSHYECSVMRVGWHDGPRNLRFPAAGLVAMGVLVVVIAQLPRLAGVARRWALTSASIALAVVAATFVAWALDPFRWQDELHFRFTAPYAALPFFLAATVAILRGQRDQTRFSLGERRLAMGGAAVFALVLGIQCVVWFQMRLSLERQLAQLPSCAPVLSVPVCRDTALRWWSTPVYVLLIQGRTPDRLLLNGSNCSRPDFAKSLVLTSGARPREAGWFDLRTVGLLSVPVSNSPR